MAIQSPCVDICKLDALTGLCLGCLRTREEIRGWKHMTDDQRLEVLGERPGRVHRVKPLDVAPVFMDEA